MCSAGGGSDRDAAFLFLHHPVHGGAALVGFAELVDPAERTVFRRMFTVGADGMAQMSWRAPEGAAAGRYRLDVRMPDGRGMDVVLGSATVSVEEFQPDTMALSLAVSPEPG